MKLRLYASALESPSVVAATARAVAPLVNRTTANLQYCKPIFVGHLRSGVSVCWRQKNRAIGSECCELHRRGIARSRYTDTVANTSDRQREATGPQRQRNKGSQKPTWENPTSALHQCASWTCTVCHLLPTVPESHGWRPRVELRLVLID